MSSRLCARLIALVSRKHTVIWVVAVVSIVVGPSPCDLERMGCMHGAGQLGRAPVIVAHPFRKPDSASAPRQSARVGSFVSSLTTGSRRHSDIVQDAVSNRSGEGHAPCPRLKRPPEAADNTA